MTQDLTIDIGQNNTVRLQQIATVRVEAGSDSYGRRYRYQLEDTVGRTIRFDAVRNRIEGEQIQVSLSKAASKRFRSTLNRMLEVEVDELSQGTTREVDI